jgi:cyclophilin family peptidyl-prolyl cis-trans isomerase
LFENVVPKTAENFKRLLLGTGNYKGRPLSLINTSIDKFLPRAYFQLGALNDGNCSIFGPKFRD